MKSVYFLARAYNDVDCRLPLLLEFAQDSNYSVKIVGIPTNAGIQNPELHELSGFATRNAIAVTTIYDLAPCGRWLRILSKLHLRVANAFAVERLFPRFHHYLTSAIFGMVRRGALRDSRFIPELVGKFESSIVIVDEIIFHRGRSFFIDALRASWRKHRGFALYAFMTGQDPYVDLWEDKSWRGLSTPAKEEVGVPLFVPGPNDARVMKAQLPNEEIAVVGNTRFDRSWVKLRSELSREGVSRIAQDVGVRPGDSKIVFMLSKLEYGVEVADLVEAISSCAALDKAVVIVKPHTRGMEFGVLGHAVSPRAINGAAYSSSDLIEWSDFVLFTGSSIAIHALMKNKKVIYLKYCQRYKSIYDNSRAMTVANSIDDVLGELRSQEPTSIDESDVRSFLTAHVYNGNESGLVCRDVKARIESSPIASTGITGQKRNA